LPSVEAVNDQRITKFKQRIVDALGSDDLGPFRQLIESFEQERNVPAVEIAAALARLVQGKEPLLLQAAARFERNPSFERGERDARSFDRPARSREGATFERAPREKAGMRDRGPPTSPRSEPRPAATHAPEGATQRHDAAHGARHDAPAARSETRPPRSHHEEGRRDEKLARMRRDDRPHVPDAGFETFRIEVGETHGVKPGNIVGAIANEAGLDSKNIGRVDIRDDHSLVDLPEGMPAEIFKHLKKVWVSGQQLRISRGGEDADGGHAHKPKPRKPPSFERGGFAPAKRHDGKPRRPK